MCFDSASIYFGVRRDESFVHFGTMPVVARARVSDDLGRKKNACDSLMVPSDMADRCDQNKESTSGQGTNAACGRINGNSVQIFLEKIGKPTTMLPAPSTSRPAPTAPL